MSYIDKVIQTLIDARPQTPGFWSPSGKGDSTTEAQQVGIVMQLRDKTGSNGLVAAMLEGISKETFGALITSCEWYTNFHQRQRAKVLSSQGHSRGTTDASMEPGRDP